jgi:sensor histidine kinase YesM
LRIVKAYLEIERLRLGEKLRVEIEVEPDALRVAIPILSIQPLIENAVKHGISPKPSGGLIQLGVRLEENGALRITVRDTGPGFPSRSSAKSGVGLDNVIRRLQLCYGFEAKLEIQSSDQGSAVSFLIPNALGAAAREVEATAP